MFLLLLCVSAIFAIPLQLVVYSTPEFIRYHNVSSVSEVLRFTDDSGIEVYYYDSQFVIAGFTQVNAENALPIARLKSITTSPKHYFYLVSLDRRTPYDELINIGEIVYTSDNTLLLQSEYDALNLRNRSSLEFTELKYTALKYMPETMPRDPKVSRNPSIMQLVNAVHPDSVMWFIQNLENFHNRYYSDPNRFEVATWIKTQFERFGITDVVLQGFNALGYSQHNVVATIPGSVNPEKYIVIGGHHDSNSNSTSVPMFAPGADDNATGTTATLEMARVMMSTGFQPKNSIRFVTFAAEEVGLFGSAHFVDAAISESSDILLAINHDMLGNNTLEPDNWQLKIVPYDGSINHSILAYQIAEAYTSLSPFFDQYNSPYSDSYNFWTGGIPITYFKEHEYSPYMHTVDDLAIHIDADYCAEIIRASAATAATYGLMTAPPNVSVADTGTGHSLIISWENSIDPSLQYYHLFYNTHGQYFENPIIVYPLLGNETSFILEGLDDSVEYFIALSTVNSEGIESYLNNTSATPRSIPRVPQNFVDEPDFGMIHFSWNANPELDIAGYHLYKSSPPNISEHQIGGLIPDTSFTDSVFEPGNEYFQYQLCAVDSDGNESQRTDIVQTRKVSLNTGILIVDDTIDGSGATPFQPSAEQVFDFVDSIMSPFQRTIKDLQADSNLRLSEIGIYECIFWHSFNQTESELFYSNIDQLIRYIELGGKLFLSTYYPTLKIGMNSGYPVIFGYDSILSSVFGIGSANYANSARFKYAIPLVPGFPALTVDPQKTISSMNGHIFRVESIEATPEAQNIYKFGSDYENTSPQGILNDLPIGVYNEYGNGKVLTLSFPLYNMDATSTNSLVNYTMHDLFEIEVSTPDAEMVPVGILTTTPVYPNPFTARSSFTVKTSDKSTPLRINVYNIKGQLVRELYNDLPHSNTQHYSWDGFDSKEKEVANGIYLLKTTQGRHSTISKAIKLK